jgi:tetratricopeptide (TPR) repeat protein
MAKAPWGSVYATEDVLQRSKTKFECTQLEPFMVKGKAKPVEAWEVGALARPSAAETSERVPLIGRDAEYAALREAVEAAAGGRGSMVEIVGETGSGKSRLLSETRRIGSELRFVHATCESYRQGVPYVIWRDILRQLLGLGWDDPDLAVIPALTAEVRSVNPDLVPWLPLLGIAIDAQIPMTHEVEELGENFRAAKLHEVVLEFLAPALEVPTLLEIEHAHMMDEASAALLIALHERLARTSWIVAVTRRDTESGFVAPNSAVRLELGPLSPEAARELAETTPEAQVVPPHVLDDAVERAAGSPEFLLDLLAAAADGSGTLPDSVDAAASARIDALAPADRTLVRRASVLGLSFHPRRLRHVLEEEPDARIWERLSTVFARDPDGEVRFKRPAVCEVAYEGLPFRLRRELHRAVADALERQVGNDVDSDPAVLSLHFSLAGEHSRAWKYALLGAERANARFAQVDAARLYRRAIEAAKSNGVTAKELAAAWEAMGEALRISGEPEAAVQAFTAARRLIPDDPVAQARLCYRHVEVARPRDRLVAAVRWANRGLRVLEGVPGQEAARWRVQLLSRLANLRERQGRPFEAERLCREVIPEAERIGEDRALAFLCLVLDTALFHAGRLDEPTNWTRALEIYRMLDDPENEAMVLNCMGLLAHVQGRWDELIELLQEVAACSRRAGNPADAAISDINIGEILFDQGRLDEADIRFRRARRVASSTGDRQMLLYADLMLGRLAVRSSDPQEGIALIEQAVSDLRTIGVGPLADFADAMLAEAEGFAGDPERADSIADRLLGSAEENVPLLRRARAIALARMGEEESSIRELELAAEAARERGEQYQLALALDALERLAGPSRSRELERDAILKRLNVVRMPDVVAPEADRRGASHRLRITA